jgi:hypothetical protein
MDIENFNQTKTALNKRMSDGDDFFKTFGTLNDRIEAIKTGVVGSGSITWPAANAVNLRKFNETHRGMPFDLEDVKCL